MFGFSDVLNHYRLSWEGGGYTEVHSAPATGLSLVREVNGVSTALYNLNVLWAINASYDMTVGRSGNTVFFSVVRVSSNTTVAQGSFADTTFASGRVGIFADSQTSRFANLDLTTTPEPSTSLLLCAGVGVMRVLRVRRG